MKAHLSSAGTTLPPSPTPQASLHLLPTRSSSSPERTTGRGEPPTPTLEKALTRISYNQTGRDIVVFEPPRLPEEIPGSGVPLSESPLKQLLDGINSRAISPREMHDLSLELYAGGILTWDEHEDLAFQAELHPDFPRTIGALTGEKPLPDQPRDYIKVWEQRLEFERRHDTFSGRAKDRALRILSVLRRIAQPNNVHA